MREEANNVVRANLEFNTPSSEESCCFSTVKEASVAGQRKPGVLIVDDDDAVRALLDVGLRQHGFVVWLAADGLEALRIYQGKGPEIDLVLLDVRMPAMDGPQTLAALSQLNPQIRSCFMTGQAGSYSQDELLKLGAAHVFAKPFQLAEVAQFLQTLLGNPRSESSGQGVT
jgi:CheY-like chemotaxis protein